MEQHYFSPSEENNRFCIKCGKYLTDESHIRYHGASAAYHTDQIKLPNP